MSETMEDGKMLDNSKCPFCGSDNIWVHYVEKPSFSECADCGARGPTKPDKNWSDRAPSSALALAQGALTKEQQFVLDWLRKEDSSAFGECKGKSLDRLIELGLARIVNPERGDYARVQATSHPAAPGDLARVTPEGWNDPADVPTVEPRSEREFIVAVRRARSGKVYTFAATYLNALPLNFEECPLSQACASMDDCGDRDGCPTTGWFMLTGDDDDARQYQRMTFEPGDEFLGWRNLPTWEAAAPEAPQVDIARVQAAHDAFIEACDNPATPTEELKSIVRDYGRFAAPEAPSVSSMIAEETEACAALVKMRRDHWGRTAAKNNHSGCADSLEDECEDIYQAIRARQPADVRQRLADERYVIEALDERLTTEQDHNKVILHFGSEDIAGELVDFISRLGGTDKGRDHG